MQRHSAECFDEWMDGTGLTGWSNWLDGLMVALPGCPMDAMVE